MQTVLSIFAEMLKQRIPKRIQNDSLRCFRKGFGRYHSEDTLKGFSHNIFDDIYSEKVGMVQSVRTVTGAATCQQAALSKP